MYTKRPPSAQAETMLKKNIQRNFYALVLAGGEFGPRGRSDGDDRDRLQSIQ